MSDEPRTLARPCALCGEPCVRMGDGAANALWLDATGKTRVVHARCKRQRTASAHAGRPRATKPPKGPRLA